MVDDLAKLPGDHGFEQKRRGLRRLRKAERAFLKQQQQQQEQVPAAATSQPGGSRKKSVAAAAAAAGATAEETCTPARTDSRGRGRQWDSRRWRASGLSDLARVVLAAATATATVRDSTAAVVNFSAVLEGLTADAGKVTGGGDEKSAAAEAAAPPPPGPGVSSKSGKKGKGAAAKGKEVAKGPATEGQGEDEEMAAARRQKEEREADVKAWAEGLREALEGETFVTTAHRAAVAARDAIVSGLADRSKVCVPPAGPPVGARDLLSNQSLNLTKAFDGAEVHMERNGFL